VVVDLSEFTDKAENTAEKAVAITEGVATGLLVMAVPLLLLSLAVGLSVLLIKAPYRRIVEVVE